MSTMGQRFPLSPLLTIIVICLNLDIYGQIKLEGKVIGEGEQPLSDIHVMVFIPSSSSVIGFDITRTDGKFHIEVGCLTDSLVIKTSSISHTEYIKKVACRNQDILIRLQSQVRNLEGITITAQRVINKGDTLSYLVQPYARNHDRTISDVIKRIPGLEVEPSGKILYQGTEVSGVLVEGSNLMENRYALLTQNLPHDKVATIEVITRFEPIKILREYASPGKVALNLKLKKDVTLTGNVELSAGLPWVKYNGNLTPILFLPHLQSLFSFQANNVGKLLGNSVGLSIPIDDRPDIPDFIPSPVPRNYTPPVVAPESYVLNISKMGSGHLLTPLGKDWEMRLAFSWADEKTNKNWSQSIGYYLPQDTLHFQESNHYIYKETQTTVELGFKHNSESFFGENKVGIGLCSEVQKGQHIKNGSLFYENYENKLQQTKWSGQWIVPTASQLLEIKTFIDYQNLPELSMRSSPGQKFFVNHSDSSTQSFSGNCVNGGLYGTLYAKLRGFKIKLQPGLTYQHLGVNTTFHTFKDGNDLTENDTHFLNQSKQGKARMYLVPEITYQNTRSTVSLGMPFHVIFINEEFLGLPQDKGNSYMTIEPYLQFYRKFVPYFSLSASLRRNYQIFEPTGIFMGYVLTSPDYLVRNFIPGKDRLIPSTTGKFYLKFNHVMSGFSAYISATHTLQEMPYIRRDSLESSGGHVYNYIQLKNQRKISYIKASASQSVPDLHFNFSLAVSAQKLKGKVKVNGVLDNSTTGFWEVNPALYFYFSIFDVVYSLYWQNLFTSLSSYPNKANSTHLSRHELMLKVSAGKNLMMSIDGAYNNVNDSHELITGAEVRYKVSAIHKFKAETGVRFNNLLNTSTFSVVNFSEYTASRMEIPLRPAQVMVFFRFNY